MMNKREFAVAGLGLAGLLPGAASIAGPQVARRPALLTVSGLIVKTNRGPFDPVLDQMMHKHGIQFSKAWAFDDAALQALPAVTIKPTLEYDAKRHTLRGPLLATVLEAVGVSRGSAVQLGLRAVDGYNAVISLADATAYRMMVATHIDGQPMALGGLGPQWALYEADTVPAFKDKPLQERFAGCPWGLYHIDVKAA
jgi:hypothetical protein